MPMNPIGAPAASALGTGTQYTMTFINNSNNAWNFCCYQKDTGILDQGALAAAWFVAQTVHPTTQVRFSWTIDYGLSWAQSGYVSPGIIYYPSQNWPVDTAQNTVTLTKSGGSYTFENQRQQDPPAAFNIFQDGTIVIQDGIGIGISMLITASSSGGSGLNPIYAQPAQPNIKTQFAVTPSYWVVFAQAIQPGQILDVTNLVRTVQVNYAPGVYSMVVTLDARNNWSMGTTADINARYLEAAKRNPDVDWMQVAADACQLVEGQS